MKRRTIIHVLIAGALLLSACEKNTDIFVPDPGQTNRPDTAWHNTITPTMPVSDLRTSLLFEPYVDSIEVTSNIATVTTPSGLTVNFPPNCCVSTAGQPVTGKVQVELMLIKKKGDMIRLDKPTTSADRLLISSGDVFVRLKKDGQPVQLAPGLKINVRYSDVPMSSLMKFFAGDESNTQHFNWLPNPDPNNNILSVGSQAYEIYTNRLRWISGSYFYDTTGITRVNVAADLAANFTNANTIAFTVFKDFRSVVAMNGDINTKKFSTIKIPSGKAITVVVISKQVNDYYLGFETTVTLTQASNGVQPVLIKPTKRSLPDILYYLSTL